MLKKRFFKTKDECEITFEFVDDQAESVAVVCEANGWQPVEMDQIKSGPFKTRLRLPLDARYQFLYLVDGNRWVADHEADGLVGNEYGGQNSVVNTWKNGS
jgi:1,4-alpha-glucan branching enzyme